jgi:hypothetical protein
MEPIQMLVPVGKCPWLVDDVQLFFAATTISKNFFWGGICWEILHCRWFLCNNNTALFSFGIDDLDG